MNTPIKTCRACNQAKPRHEFHKKRSSRDGLNATCKACRAQREEFNYRPGVQEGLARCSVCHNEYPATEEYFSFDSRSGKPCSRCRRCNVTVVSEWQKKNPERTSRNKRKWDRRNLEQKREIGRRYYHANKEKYRQYYREHYAEHLANNRRHYYKDVERSRAYSREYNRNWRVNNPRTALAITQRHAARKRDLPYEFSELDWQRALEYFDHKCAVCQRSLNGLFHTVHADHWIPLSDPNCPGTVPTNMVPLCGGTNGCNNSKGPQEPTAWLGRRFGPRKAAKILKRITEYFEQIGE